MGNLTVAFSIERPEAVFQNVVGHIYTGVPPIIASRPEVNAGKYPSVLDFLERIRKTRERPSHAGHEIGVNGERGLVAKIGREHLGSRPTRSRMARRIFRM